MRPSLSHPARRMRALPRARTRAGRPGRERDADGRPAHGVDGRAGGPGRTLTRRNCSGVLRRASARANKGRRPRPGGRARLMRHWGGVGWRGRPGAREARRPAHRRIAFAAPRRHPIKVRPGPTGRLRPPCGCAGVHNRVGRGTGGRWPAPCAPRPRTKSAARALRSRAPPVSPGRHGPRVTRLTYFAQA